MTETDLAEKWIKQSKLEYEMAKDINCAFRKDLLRERAYTLEACANESIAQRQDTVKKLLLTACNVPRELLQELLDYVIEYLNTEENRGAACRGERVTSAKNDIERIEKILKT